MFGDTDLETSVMPSEPAFQTPPTAVPIPPAPIVQPPKPKTSILPILFGFLIVVILSAVFGVIYYKNKLTVSPSPSPTVSPSVAPSLTPSISPSSTPSASPKSSGKASAKPSTTPSSTTKPSATPTPTPTPLTTLDIRFGNPSVNVKQTYDDGSGAGRVINREYTSIQVGEFDEVPSSWSPRVTVCFHLVAGEEIKGKDLKFTLSLDDKTDVEDNLGQYDKLEAGKLYDWCHDVTTDIGRHTVKLSLNGDKSIKEANYSNNLARLDWVNLADKIAPNYTLTGPTSDAGKTCLTLSYLSDNVTKNFDLKIEEKFDSESWKTTTATTYCTTGTSGSSHTYTAKVTDARGNVNEQTKAFVLY